MKETVDNYYERKAISRWNTARLAFYFMFILFILAVLYIVVDKLFM